MTVIVDQLPPTQYLILEVLAARFRLGEWHWTFPRHLGAAIARLVDAGLVEDESGVDGWRRVRFTEAGHDAMGLDVTYVPLPQQRALNLAQELQWKLNAVQDGREMRDGAVRDGERIRIAALLRARGQLEAAALVDGGAAPDAG